ncbi:MAG TPA: ATP-binding protein [Steroidobacteraceae bacterium]|jgi:C4-dicarboxylate-specific signal transduction histidine kinase
MPEIKRLQGCVNDLIGVVALSAVWANREPKQIIDTLLKVLIRRLTLEFAVARLSANSPVSSAEVLRTASLGEGGQGTSRFPSQISTWLDADSPLTPFRAPNPLGPGRISVVPFRFDLQCRIGTLVVASARNDFPSEIEMLVLRIAVNQAAMALHEAQRALELKDELAAERLAMTRLHEFSTRLWPITDLPAVLEEALSATIEIQQADFGNIQLCNPQSHALEIVTQRGFDAESLEYFAGVVHSGSACGRALQSRSRIVIEDVEIDEQFAPHRHIALAAGFRSVQSTPLFSRRGEVLGMISTHFKRPHRPSERELRLTDLYARQAAEMVERRRTDAEHAKLAAHIDRLTHASRLVDVGQWTTSIAHEINQPLGGVILNSNACIRWLNRDVPDLQEARAAVENIIRDANRASDVIRSIRAFVSRAPTHKHALDVNAIICEVVSMLDEQLRGSRIETTLALSDAAVFVPADRIQLQQVLVNLVVNAIEALRPLTSRPRRLRICSRRDIEDRVTVRVEDEGVGPDEQVMDRLFDPFFTTKQDGMGLGLSISRGIIEAHGGELNAARNGLHGLTMTFSLPAFGQLP